MVRQANVGGCEAKTWCYEYNGEIALDAINASRQYGDDYNRIIRLYGDFSVCVPMMNNANGRYHLFTNNCTDVSLSILAQADTIYRDALLKAAKCLTPKKAHDVLLENLPPQPNEHNLRLMIVRLVFKAVKMFFN